MSTTTKTSSKVVNYKEFTAMLKEKHYDKATENVVTLTCVRKTANGTYQAEFLERKPSLSSSTNSKSGMNLTFLINRGHDERFREFLRIERAWATLMNLAALEELTGKLAEEDVEALNSFAPDSEDRLRIMKNLPTIEHDGKKYQVHIGVTEVRQLELEEGSIALNKSQLQSLEHENSIKQTHEGKFIVCGTSGSQIRKITEVKALEVGASLDELDTIVPNQVLQEVFIGTNPEKVVITDKNVDIVTESIFGQG